MPAVRARDETEQSLLVVGYDDAHDPRDDVPENAWHDLSHLVLVDREVIMTPQEQFDDLVGELVSVSGVTPPGQGKGFGAAALRVGGKIFAMLAHERLVVKLPAARVDELVGTGDGVRFDANKGVPMKEWLSLDPDSPLSWHELAREALAFVAAR